MFNFIILTLILFGFCESRTEGNMSMKAKCLNPPRTAKKVETNIKDCQEEVKNKIVKEALELLHQEFESKEPREMHYDSMKTTSEEETKPKGNNFHMRKHIIHKRSLLYHPTLVPQEDKRIAGCLLHCVYAKNNAIDKYGWPTLDGLVEFYSEGVNEHGFFMATLRAVNLCLRAVSHKYRINRYRYPEKGESCDLAFDVFDCISDQITNYCFSFYSHD